MAKPGAMHEALTPLKWLIGTWVCKEGSGKYPTISPFTYSEQIEFKSLGQPLLHYSMLSWKPDTKAPMHSESGFLRIQPNTNKVAFLVAHNFGVTTLEEGEVLCDKILLKSVQITRMSFAKDPAVTKLERVFSLQDGKLEQVLFMETCRTPLSEHLRCRYEKVCVEG